jgi:hypothetical protein
MKIELKIRINIEEAFEKRLFDQSSGMFSPKFRSDLLSYLGHLMKVEEEDKATIDSFIIKRIPEDSQPDPDINNDVTGQAI